jgi:ComF family protein
MNFISNIINLVYPNLCLICGENLLRSENRICLNCISKIPRTNFHRLQNNAVEKRFWGKVKIEKGTSFFYFAKGSAFQKILHELKYNGNKETGKILGMYAAADLCENNYFDEVDMIIPIPLHPKKLQKRGYNQSEWIGQGLSEILKKPMETKFLHRMRDTATQTKKGVFERFENTEGIFSVSHSELLAGKHVLVVDDVLTTGSTIEAAAQALLSVESVKVSIFTLAVA